MLPFTTISFAPLETLVMVTSFITWFSFTETFFYMRVFTTLHRTGKKSNLYHHDWIHKVYYTVKLHLLHALGKTEVIYTVLVFMGLLGHVSLLMY